MLLNFDKTNAYYKKNCTKTSMESDIIVFVDAIENNNFSIRAESTTEGRYGNPMIFLYIHIFDIVIYIYFLKWVD